jgi:hypothetical protein
MQSTKLGHPLFHDPKTPLPTARFSIQMALGIPPFSFPSRTGFAPASPFMPEDTEGENLQQFCPILAPLSLPDPEYTSSTEIRHKQKPGPVEYLKYFFNIR